MTDDALAVFRRLSARLHTLADDKYEPISRGDVSEIADELDAEVAGLSAHTLDTLTRYQPFLLDDRYEGMMPIESGDWVKRSDVLAAVASPKEEPLPYGGIYGDFQNKPKRVAPNQPPRYDDVFYEGVAALDASAESDDPAVTLNDYGRRCYDLGYEAGRAALAPQEEPPMKQPDPKDLWILEHQILPNIRGLKHAALSRVLAALRVAPADLSLSEVHMTVGPPAPRAPQLDLRDAKVLAREMRRYAQSDADVNAMHTIEELLAEVEALRALVQCERRLRAEDAATHLDAVEALRAERDRLKARYEAPGPS